MQRLGASGRLAKKLSISFSKFFSCNLESTVMINDHTPPIIVLCFDACVLWLDQIVLWDSMFFFSIYTCTYRYECVPWRKKKMQHLLITKIRLVISLSFYILIISWRSAFFSSIPNQRRLFTLNHKYFNRPFLLHVLGPSSCEIDTSYVLCLHYHSIVKVEYLQITSDKRIKKKKEHAYYKTIINP